MSRLNKNVQFLILFAFLGVAMMVVTFSYAAFNTELIITGDALIEAIKEETLATYVDSLANKSDDVVKLGYGTRYVGNNPNWP